MARKRRTFTSEFKTEIVLQLISGEKRLAEVCREYQLNSQMVSRWKQELLQNAASVFEHKKGYSAEQERIAKLEQALGRKTLELEIAKKASSVLAQLERKN
ncbi:MAG: transposase [Candidatus Helarchaeota archaeon]